MLKIFIRGVVVVCSDYGCASNANIGAMTTFRKRLNAKKIIIIKQC